jgi:hypothetical protein
MNWKLLWHRATHHLFYGDGWVVIIGPDISHRDWGVTWNWGECKPLGDWRCWRHEWRINVRWPISVRIKERKVR